MELQEKPAEGPIEAIPYRELAKENVLNAPLAVGNLPANVKVYAVGGLKNIDPGATTTLRKGQMAVEISVAKDVSRVEIRPLSESPVIMCERDSESNKFFIGLKLKR